MDKRILELAVEALEGQKAAVEAEIESIRTQLRGGAAVKQEKIAAPAVRKRRGRTAAQRKAQSEKMKAYWASRRKKAAPKKPAVSRKGPKSTAARKAQSERMKAYWAKRRKEKEGRSSA